MKNSLHLVFELQLLWISLVGLLHILRGKRVGWLKFPLIYSEITIRHCKMQKY